jgi:TRAP-type C4-dicarboxylate transport system permease small subunit
VLRALHALAAPITLLIAREDSKMRFISATNEFLGRAVSYLLVVAVVATVWEVFSRYVMNAPTTWAHELTILLCGVMFLISGPYVTKRDTHVSITSLYDILPRKIRLGVDVLHAVVTIGFLFFFCWGAYVVGIKALTRWETTGSAWNPPNPAIIKPTIAIATFLMLIQVIANIYQRLTRSRKQPADL